MGVLATLAMLLAGRLSQGEVGSAEIRRLIDQLGSDNIEERSRASARLRETGKEGLRLLKEAGQGTHERAARARELFRWIETDLSLSDNVRKLVPRAAERLLSGDVADIFLELTERDKGGALTHPELTAGQLEPFAAPALRSAGDGQKLPALWRIAEWNLRSAASEAARLLAHPNSDVREAAVAALGQLDARESAAEILKSLEDPDPNVRGAAARVLGELGAIPAIPKLVERLKDKAEPGGGGFVLEEPGMTIRAQAASSLCRLQDRRGVETIVQDGDAFACWGFCLNALRRRDGWGSLGKVHAKERYKGSCRAVLEQLAAQGGMSLDVAELRDEKALQWLSKEIELENPGSRSVRALLEEKSFRAPVAMVLEVDRIRLLSPDSAMGFWREWMKADAAGPQK